MRPIALPEFHSLRNEEFTMVLDVMSEDEFARSHIPGAWNVPMDAPDFDERVRRAVPDRATTIVLYCHGRDCDESLRAAYRLEGMGYRNVHDFQDGITAWREAGLNLASEPRATVSR